MKTFIAWLRRFFLLPSRREAWPEFSREYEWRHASGAPFRGPTKASDACQFWLRSHALGWVVTSEPKPPDTGGAGGASESTTGLGLFVVRTGERVGLDQRSRVGVGARLNAEGAEWQKFDGVKP